MSRALSILVALALAVPVTVATGFGLCGAEVIVAGNCCCDNGDDEAPDHPTVERLCCCEVTEVAEGSRVDDRMVSPDGPELPQAISVATTVVRLAELPSTTRVADAHARGPPSRSLLSQRTSFLC